MISCDPDTDLPFVSYLDGHLDVESVMCADDVSKAGNVSLAVCAWEVEIASRYNRVMSPSGPHETRHGGVVGGMWSLQSCRALYFVHDLHGFLNDVFW